MNLDNLLRFNFPELEYTLTARDVILYSLGIGVGSRPTDARELRFVYEKALRVFPSQVNVICHPVLWVREPSFAIDWLKVVHGEQFFEIHRPLSVDTTYVGGYRILDVVDKGPGKGALVYMRKELREKASGTRVSTVVSTLFLRGDGGSGGTVREAPAPFGMPEREPDLRIAMLTLPQAALLYRLSGDYNPIHADPEAARQAGFERPILHGLCSLGVATCAVLQACCEDEPERLRSLQLRFTSPVYPGETLVTEIWRVTGGVSFRTRVAERDVVVLNNGRAIVEPR